MEFPSRLTEKISCSAHRHVAVEYENYFAKPHVSRWHGETYGWVYKRDGKASKFGEFYSKAGITDVRDNRAQSTATNQNVPWYWRNSEVEYK